MFFNIWILFSIRCLTCSYFYCLIHFLARYSSRFLSSFQNLKFICYGFYGMGNRRSKIQTGLPSLPLLSLHSMQCMYMNIVLFPNWYVYWQLLGSRYSSCWRKVAWNKRLRFAAFRYVAPIQKSAKARTNTLQTDCMLRIYLAEQDAWKHTVKKIHSCDMCDKCNVRTFHINFDSTNV